MSSIITGMPSLAEFVGSVVTRGAGALIGASTGIITIVATDYIGRRLGIPKSALRLGHIAAHAAVATCLGSSPIAIAAKVGIAAIAIAGQTSDLARINERVKVRVILEKDGIPNSTDSATIEATSELFRLGVPTDQMTALQIQKKIAEQDFRTKVGKVALVMGMVAAKYLNDAFGAGVGIAVSSNAAGILTNFSTLLFLKLQA